MEEKFDCPEDSCDEQTKSRRGMTMHARSMHDIEINWKKEYTCANCDESFEDYKSRRESKDSANHFCSKDCKDSFEAKDGLDTNCAECDSEIHIPPSHVKEVDGYEQKNHFCDKECESKFKKREWVGENHPSWDGGRTRIYCDECGEEFWVKPSIKERSRFCSRDCFNKNQSIDKKEYKCANCSDIVVKHPNEVRGEETTCSQQCLNEYLSEIRKGKANPQWKGGRFLYYGPNWQDQRSKALERDDYSCEECDMTRDSHYQHYNEDLHVHHKVPRRQIIDEDEPTFEQFELANSLDNLVTLCKSCHKKLEDTNDISRNNRR